VVSSKC
ncbi:sigma-54 interaction domain protein, partial [Vibrio parahaemolyticus V-223/04]